MGCCRILLVGTAVGNVRAHHDQRRPGVVLCCDDRPIDGCEVVGVFQPLNVPAVRLEAAHGVVAARQLCFAVDCDVVVVVEPDQVPQPQMPGEGRNLVGYPLHQVAVAREEVCPVAGDVVAGAVEQLRQVGRGQSHSGGVPYPLPQGTRGGLHARRPPELRVSRRVAAELPESLDVVEGNLVPGQVQQAVEQHRRMAARQDKTVAPCPVGVGWIVPQVSRPQDVAQGRQSHRRTRMPGVRRLDGVHGEGTDCVDAKVVERNAGHGDGLCHLPAPHGVGDRCEGTGHRFSAAET